MALARSRALRVAGALAGVDVETVCTGQMGCTPPGRGAAMLAALLEKARANQ